MAHNIVLIGAGSVQFGVDSLGDIFQSKPLKGSRVMLHDINAEALAKTMEKAQKFIDKHQLDFTVDMTTDRKKALEGAEFIISSIEVGDRFALWDMDWRIPQQYGIRQVYGENGGPGGLFHSLRILPPILAICDDIMEVCPDAWVFNFSNPMSRICTTVNRKHPELKFVGLCHEIASLKDHFPKILDKPYEELEVRAGGLNHFSVVSEVKDKQDGRDLYPQLMANAPEYFEKRPGFSDLYRHYKETAQVIETENSNKGEVPEDMVAERPWSDHTLAKAIMDQFGVFPITNDSHFGEYIHWAYEVADHKGIMDFYSLYRAHLGHGQPEIELVRKERVVTIIEGIIADSGYEEPAVNIANLGHIEGLPEWISVEVPATVHKDGLRGVDIDLPAGIRGLFANQVAVHDLTAEAVLKADKQLVIQALLVDPIVDKCVNVPELVDVMIESQAPYLDYLK